MTTQQTTAGAYDSLIGKIRSGDALVGVIGLGYVGLPLAHAMHEGGLPVLGFDIDPKKIEALAQGRNYLKHLGAEMTETLSASGRFESTTDFARLGEADAVLVCVPTPLGKHHEPDLSYVIASGEAIGRTLRSGQLVVLESTTYPGTTRDDFLPAMLGAAKQAGRTLAPGEDVFVAFSPEREDPGRKTHTTRTIPKLVGGLDERSTEAAALLYERGVEQVVRVATAEIAEAGKILENTFRAVNIALVNELKTILDPMGIDVWEVIRAAATKPFGFMPFWPGPGLGGHCIPIDPFYLSWKARETGRPTRFIELAGEINTAMPDWVVAKVASALNDHAKAVKGSKILVIGLAYKPDIDDTRESPSFELIEKLRHMGAQMSYHDPLVPETYPVRKHDLGMKSVALTGEAIRGFDCVLISTNHSDVDYAALAEHARLIVDTRDAMRPWTDQLGDRLARA
ncbi:MAG: nucleotide sugar dehydrogenase [Phycisphaerales bacterium]